jgi:hypothetical protein
MNSQGTATLGPFTVDAEWQSALPRRTTVRHMADVRDGHGGALFEANALTAAFNLEAKPVCTSTARKVVGTYAVPYDIVVERLKRRRRLDRAPSGPKPK